jgi:hypothetical protein
VAQRFGYDYAAFRQLVGQFRAACADGQAPPFSAPPGRDGRPAPVSRPPPSPSAPPPPMAGPWAWSRGGACGPAWPASSCSYPCWPDSASMTSSARRAIPARAGSPPRRRCWPCWP